MSASFEGEAPASQLDFYLYLSLTLTLTVTLPLTVTLTLTRATFYLCKQKSEGFQACELSVDFTQHYGENVYVCRA